LEESPAQFYSREWDDRPTRGHTDFRTRLYRPLSHLAEHITRDDDIEHCCAVGVAPWETTKVKTHSSDCSKEEDAKNHIAQMKKLLAQFGKHHIAYTDGSRLDNDKVGADIYIDFPTKRAYKVPLGALSEVYDAELAGIYEAAAHYGR
jgi:hypothetical protein